MLSSIFLGLPSITSKIYSFVCSWLQRLNLIRHVQRPAPRYTTNLDVENLDRYEPGGYHPVALGDVLKGGRYKILHKLGWGSHGTTWAAKDQRDNRYVAVKIMVSKTEHSRELRILRALSALPKDHPGSSYVNQMLDHFTLVGPNGTHNCLVLELVGPNVQEFVEVYCIDGRLPSKLVKLFAKQTLQGIDFLAANNIGHGDLHTGNLAIVVPGLDSLNEQDFIAELGEFDTDAVTKLDDGPWAPNVPTQMIRPAIFPEHDIMEAPCPSIKIIDFGEAFFGDDAPGTLKAPLVLRAPEIIFGDRPDLRVDLWTAGCLIFELVVGIHLFYGWVPPNVVDNMFVITSDELPSRWQAKWRGMQQDEPHRFGGLTLQKRLERLYFMEEKDAEFTVEEIGSILKTVAGLLRLEPSLRATASESLAHDWLQ
ncbi:hypothetical protein E4U13_004407 [Claviceps humidiphila]|uniref:non-specific serine/threonine protein kinase n=1 Tax=Claviceps humidiphila TaxID=1294629 RepID=A0A9P7PY97_9HYPO|nr:hypothetical protein E4U13_004407 [Claviceps humidiphila]